MGGWPGICRDPDPGPANSRDCNWDRNKATGQSGPGQKSEGQSVFFSFLNNLTYICRDSRDCPTGRKSRSVPALFVFRGIGTGTEVCGTSGTVTNFRGTVPHGCSAVQAEPGQKSRDCTVPSTAHPSFKLPTITVLPSWNWRLNLL